MKLLVIFAAALLCVQAARVPYIVTDEDGEKYEILLPQGGQRQGGRRQQQQQQLPLVSVANHPAYGLNSQNYQVYLPPNQQGVVNYAVGRGPADLYLPRGLSIARAPDNEDSDEDDKWQPVYRKSEEKSAEREEDSAKESGSDSSEEEEDERKRRKQKAKKRKESGSDEDVDKSDEDDKDDEDDEEENKNVDIYNLILPNSVPQQVHIPGLGVVNRPAVKKVKVEVPQYADVFLRQQIIEQFLAAQGLNPQAFDVQGLLSQQTRAPNPYNTGWDQQYSDNQQALETRKLRKSINLQQLMYVTVPERRRRAAPALSNTETPLESTTSTLDTTTVPDVTETSTITETTTMTELPESVTVTTDSPQTATKQPTESTPIIAVITSQPILEIELTPEPEKPFIPLFGYGSILPAEISRVPFTPSIPVSSEESRSIEDVAAEGLAPLFTMHNRRARAVPFDAKEPTQLKKATPVPPVPKTDLRGPKMSSLPKSRSLRAVDVTPSPIVTETDAAVVPKIVESTTPVNCDIVCTKFDLNPVCGFNGECYNEFPNQCAMDTFVCKHPELGFTSTPRERCVMHWLTRCTEQDLKN